MNYIIHTPSTRKLKDEILARVSAKVDCNGIGITTLQSVEIDSADKVLVLTIALDQHVKNNYRTEYDESANNAVQILDSLYFSMSVMEFSKTFNLNLPQYDSLIITICIEGDCQIHVRSTGENVLLKQGHSTLIPVAIADYDVNFGTFLNTIKSVADQFY